jgi:hypothetical protein
MGLIANIFKTTYDCSNGGVSSECSEVTIVNIEGPFEPTEDRPAVLLVENAGGTVKIVPAVEVEDANEYHGKWAPKLGSMMGGTYVATSDSRFTNAVERLLGSRFYGAVPFHDRYESPELAAMLGAD